MCPQNPDGPALGVYRLRASQGVNITVFSPLSGLMPVGCQRTLEISPSCVPTEPDHPGKPRPQHSRAAQGRWLLTDLCPLEGDRGAGELLPCCSVRQLTQPGWGSGRDTSVQGCLCRKAEAGLGVWQVFGK